MTNKTLSKYPKHIKSKFLTQSQLKKELYYDQVSGTFRRVCLGYSPDCGPKVGTQNGRGRICIYVNGKVYEASRLAVLWMEGFLPEKPYNHRNGILYDNRWKNLTTNLSHNQSGQDGVYWSKKYKGWVSYIITRSGSRRIVGTFRNKEESISVMREAQSKYDDEGRLNRKDLYEIISKYINR